VVTNPDEQSGTKSGGFTVNPPPPVAGFTDVPTSGTVPLTVAFMDASTGTPTMWNWSFGDGTPWYNTTEIGNRNPPTHQYTNPQTYTVTLIVSNAGGSDTKTDYITVLPPPPVAGFTRVPASGIVPLTVQFTDRSTGGSPTMWNWSFGDGIWVNTTDSSFASPSHTYTSVGTYTVNLMVSNAGGNDTKIKNNYITVSIVPPVAGFTSDYTSGMRPLTVQFTDTSTESVTSRLWTFGDGLTSTEQNPSHQYTNTGSYTVQLTVSNDGGSNTESKMNYITVSPVQLVAQYTWDPPEQMEGQQNQVHFVSTSTGGQITEYEWDFGDNTIGTTASIDHSFLKSGVYYVKLTVTDYGGQVNDITHDISILANTTTTSTSVSGLTYNTSEAAETTPILDLNVANVANAGGVVSYTGQTVTIQNPDNAWKAMTFVANNVDATQSGNLIMNNVQEVNVESQPQTVALDPSVGTVSTSLNVSLKQYVENVPVETNVIQGVSSDVFNGFQLVANTNGQDVKDVAYSLEVKNAQLIDTNLTTITGHIAAKITMSISDAWVQSHGPTTDAIKIIRYSDDGATIEMLTTRFLGRDGANDVFEADSPNGLSIFGLVSLAAQQAASQGNQGGTTGSAGTNTESAGTAQSSNAGTYGVSGGGGGSGGSRSGGQVQGESQQVNFPEQKATEQKSSEPGTAKIKESRPVPISSPTPITPFQKPAIITDVGMFTWLFGIILENPIAMAIVIAIIPVVAYFGWWKNRI
jgi:PKD repeat protein